MNFLSYRPQTELEFLSRQTMVFDTGNSAAVGTLATITPADGLTFVLIGAKISLTAITLASTAKNCEVHLLNEANIRDILGYAGGTVINGAGGGAAGDGISVVKGDILVGDGIKTYTLEIIAANGMTIAGTIYGYLRNT